MNMTTDDRKVKNLYLYCSLACVKSYRYALFITQLIWGLKGEGERSKKGVSFRTGNTLKGLDFMLEIC